jgi:lysyl endopeptidase
MLYIKQWQRLFWIGLFFTSITSNAQRLVETSLDLNFDLSTSPIFSFEKVDHQLVLDQDEREMQGKAVAQRFAIGFPVEIDLTDNTYYINSSSSYTHHAVQITLNNAMAMGIIFHQFNLPKNTYLSVVNANNGVVLGALDYVSNNPLNKMNLPFLPGKDFIFVYSFPTLEENRAKVHIGQVNHVYRDIFKTQKGFGDSGPCNVNMTCEEDTNWHQVSRAVGMVLIGSAQRWCSGTLINTTSEEVLPYFLTANHCIEETSVGPTGWSFIFNYQSPTCDPTEDGPLSDQIFGATVKARNNAQDFALLEFVQEIPEDFDVYYAGWSRQSSGFEATVGIHHPSGDVKKISKDYDPPALTAYLGGNGDDFWEVSDWDEGTTEGGSSGSALFSEQYQILGQLRGGFASCSNDAADYYGALFLAWEGSTADRRLKDWLDPLDINPLSLPGREPLDTGVVEPDFPDKPLVYPNPANGFLNIEFPDSREIRTLQFFTIDGKVAMDYTLNIQQRAIYNLPLTNLAQGMYILEVETSLGVFTTKIMITE